MRALLGLSLLACLAASPGQTRILVEQFYIDYTGKKVSRAIDRPPIAYGPNEQMFFFLGHFRFVDTPSFRKTPYHWLCGWATEEPCLPFVYTDLLNGSGATVVNTPSNPVNEPKSITMLLMMLTFFGIVQAIKAKRCNVA